MKNVVGQVVLKICLIEYHYQEKINSDNTPLQLELSNGEVIFFDGASDGETLRLQNKKWEDPFTESLSDENIEFVKRYGKWKLVDVSEFHPYNSLIGKVVSHIEFVVNNVGKQTGVQLLIEDKILDISIEFDEVIVNVKKL